MESSETANVHAKCNHDIQSMLSCQIHRGLKDMDGPKLNRKTEKGSAQANLRLNLQERSGLNKNLLPLQIIFNAYRIVTNNKDILNYDFCYKLKPLYSASKH